MALLVLCARPVAAQQAALALSLAAPAVDSCGSLAGTVTLAVAPAGGASVSLQSDDPAARVPATVEVAPHETSAAFAVEVGPVRALTIVHITARLGTDSATVSLEVRAPYAYTVEDLGTLGGDASFATAINARGQMAGVSSTATGRLHGFRTDAAGRMTDITPTRTEAVRVAALNDGGQVAGWLEDATGKRTAFFTDPAGTVNPIPITGAAGSQAFAINAAGEVAGFFTTASGDDRAFWRAAGGGVTDLGTFANGTRSYAFALTPDGAVVGYGDDGNLIFTFRTQPGGRVANAARVGPHAYGYAVNEAGAVAGEFYNAADGYFHAFRSRPDGSYLDLGTFAGHDAAAYSINGRGEAVGATYILGGPGGHAILYTDAGGLRDLNNLIPPSAGWELVNAAGINDAGQIAGYGRHNGALRAFRLSPTVPPARYGDADVNGLVTATDVSYLLGVAGGLLVPPGPALLAGDVAPSPSCSPGGFGDNRLDLLDAVRVLRRVRSGETVWP
jgi:probable HAF family extracellular repeat protein